MPVSGIEETGVIARMYSNCSADVPIKKRRFPLVKAPSPPPQEPSSIHTENGSVQKDNSNPSQESSLSDSSVATNSPGLLSSKNFFPEKRKAGLAGTNFDAVEIKVNLPNIKLEEPSLTSCLGSVDNMDCKEKLLLTEKSCQNTPDNVELHLASIEGLPLCDVKGILGKQKVVKECRLENAGLFGNVELSLGPKKPCITDVAGQNSEQSLQTLKEVENSSVCLSSGKGNPVTKLKMADLSSSNDDRTFTNRSNWDLNTTMDAWEGSVLDTAAAFQGGVGFHGSNGIGVTVGVKPSISLAGKVGGSVDSGKQILGGAESINSQLSKPDDPLHLRLSTYLLPSNFGGEDSGSSAKVVPSRIFPNSSFLEMSLPTGKVKSVGGLNVKSEPFEEFAKHNLAEAQGNYTKSLDFRTLRREELGRDSPTGLNLSNTSPHNLVEHRPIKPEPMQEIRTVVGTSHQSDGKAVHCDNNFSSMTVMPLNSHKPCPSGVPTCSEELSVTRDMSDQTEFSDYTACTKTVDENNATPRKRCSNVDQVVSKKVASSLDHLSKQSNVFDGVIEASAAKDLNEDPSACGLKLVNELTDSRTNGEGSVSDDEKFNISADIPEDSYTSDYESDGNHAVMCMGDAEDRRFHEEEDEYEDGEVREQVLHIVSEVPIVEKIEAANMNLGDCDIKIVDSGSPGDESIENILESGVCIKQRRIVDDEDHLIECANLHEKTDQAANKDSSLQESSTVEVAGAEPDEKGLLTVLGRKLLDRSGSGGEDVQMGNEAEISFSGTANGRPEALTAVDQAANGSAKGTHTVEKAYTSMGNSNLSGNGVDVAKDSSTGGNRSRIINLPRATNVSPYKTSSFPGRSFPVRSGRERYSDFEGGKFHQRGNRDDSYYNDRKFMRERFQDQSLRNSRPNFFRGRGRFSRRVDTPHGDWASGRDFDPEIYKGPTDYHFSRHKHASATTDAELECSGYIIAPDGASVGAGRGGRKPLDTELSSFRPSSRRRSPGGRDRPATRGMQMSGRIPRSIGPSRCIGEDESHMVGLRRDEKFMRGVPDNVMDPVFTHTQPPYDRADGQFGGGDRNFSFVQRRGLPKFRSKSPIRSRTRSPGPWSSPRRRSPDGFNGSQELPHRRSPGTYRMERIRSPDRPCFPDEMLARRHGSPPLFSRPSTDMRDVESRRDHGHPRFVVARTRSPSDRVLPRSSRRFVDPQERTDADEYYEVPMHSGRFHDLGSDGNGDERYKCGERRGPVRSFRPPYNCADADNFHFRVEDGSRPFRLCPEDSEFLERSTLREREFDGRIKNRSVNASRRTRNIEEQEVNYRNSEQVRHDDGIDAKRRKF